MDAQQTSGGGGVSTHPDECMCDKCMCDKCCQRKMTTSSASIAREFDDEDDDDMGGNTLDVTDMAMMGVVLMANGGGGGAGRDHREEEARAPSSDNAVTTTTRQQLTQHTAQTHPADCLCEACCRAQIAAGITEDHGGDCECEECCRRLMMTMNKSAVSHAQTTTNQPNDGGSGTGRVPATHHRECLCEFCCRKIVLESIAAQDERDRRELGHTEDDEDDEEDEEDEDDVYYDYEYDYDDYQMYGWVGADTSMVGGAVGRITTVRGTASHTTKRTKPRKQSSAAASSRSGTKRRRSKNPSETLAVGTASTVPVSARPSASPDNNPSESLRQALLVNDDLGIMQNRGVLQAIVDAISTELLDDGFTSPRDRVRMTDIAQLARQVMDASTDGAPNGTPVATDAKKKKKKKKKSTTVANTAGNKKKRKRLTTVPPAASASLPHIGEVGGTSHRRGKGRKSDDVNDASTGSATPPSQSAAVVPNVTAAITKHSFDQRLEELKQFKEKHGHFKVPTSNMTLYSWLRSKKKAYAEGGAWRTYRINPEEAEALRDIGVDMDGNDKKTSVLFRQRLEELKQFKERHGHFKVPTSNRNLYMWLRSKKKAYAEGGAYRNHRISPEEAEALRDIGVDMDGNDKKTSAEGTRNNKRRRPKDRASAGSAALSLQPATVTPSIAAATTKNRFDQRLEELKQFKERHGHFKVPSRGGNKSLYEWLHAKKKAYAEGGRTSSRSILPEEVKALQDIGVDMDDNDKKTSVLFRQRLEELERFKEKHGHFKVPKSNSKLYAWLYVKKRAYAEGGGYRFYRITPEEAKALRDIGVDMDCTARKKRRGGGEEEEEEGDAKPSGAGSAVLASGRSRFADRKRRAGRGSSRDRCTVAAAAVAVAAEAEEGQEEDQGDGNGGENNNVNAGDDSRPTCRSTGSARKEEGASNKDVDDEARKLERLPPSTPVTVRQEEGEKERELHVPVRNGGMKTE